MVTPESEQIEMADKTEFPAVASPAPLPTIGEFEAAEPGIQRLSLSEQALTLIRQAMVAGDMRPGEIYSAAALAQRLRVSNSPVREAMLTLVNEGLMEPVRNRGYRVVPIAERDLQHIFEIRLMLEVPSMRKLAEIGTVQDLPRFQRLADTIVSTADSKDITGYLLADRDFHLGLTAQLDNPRLVTLIGNLRDQTRLFGLHALAESARLVESAAEHRKLLDAIVASDVELTGEIATATSARIKPTVRRDARPDS
jgi:DNA-binding GntR family transcriptional regulator